MDLDMDFEEMESEDEGPFSVVKKPKVDLAETTDKPDNVVQSFAAANTKDHGPEAKTIAAAAPATATVSNTSAWSRFQFQFRPRSQSCPTITEVHDQSSRTGSTHFRGHRLGAHVICRRKRCRVRDDDSDSSGSLQDEAGDVQPAKPIEALEEKEPKLDLIPDADPLGLEVSQEIMSRDDLLRLLRKKDAEAMQARRYLVSMRAELNQSRKTVGLYRRKLAQVCKKLIDVKRAQVEIPDKFRNEWKDVRNKGDIPSSTTFALRRQEPNLAHIIDVSDEDEEEKAAAAAAARSATVAQVANAVQRANAFLRQTANEEAKENVQPAAATTSSSGGRLIWKRASRLPLAPRRP